MNQAEPIPARSISRTFTELPARPLITKLLILAAPFAIFVAFLFAADPDAAETIRKVLRSTLGTSFGWSEVLLVAAPISLAALATAIPARAHLVNVGAEGQLAIGALFATYVAVSITTDLPAVIALPTIGLAGMIGGALWASVAGFARIKLGTNETIFTLLTNFIAFLVVGQILDTFLKDPGSFNWPFSEPFSDSNRLPTIGDLRLHWGVFVSPIFAGITAYIVSRTVWGLRLRAVGGNLNAAIRSGIKVNRYQLFALVVAGALAGLGGMIEVAGVEGRLRPTTGVGIGYAGFLAAWMVRHNPILLVFSSLLIGAITVSGDALQINSGLPSSSTDILTALLVGGVLFATYRKSSVSS